MICRHGIRINVNWLSKHLNPIMVDDIGFIFAPIMVHDNFLSWQVWPKKYYHRHPCMLTYGTYLVNNWQIDIIKAYYINILCLVAIWTVWWKMTRGKNCTRFWMNTWKKIVIGVWYTSSLSLSTITHVCLSKRDSYDLKRFLAIASEGVLWIIFISYRVWV